ncbi:MAG TPA: hypothetical protein VH419_05205 [Nocardioidaceae bacterium]|jgi:hypothetical protein
MSPTATTVAEGGAVVVELGGLAGGVVVGLVGGVSPPPFEAGGGAHATIAHAVSATTAIGPSVRGDIDADRKLAHDPSSRA